MEKVDGEDKATEKVDGEDKPIVGFPLKGTIRIVIRDRGVELVHIFAPVSAADWLEYDRMSRTVMETSAEEIVSDSMHAEAGNWLWEERIESVEGYPKLPAPGSVEENWRDYIRVGHRLSAVRGLAQVAVMEGGEPELSARPGSEQVVLLEATRNGQKFERLKHVFAEPTTRQAIEYSRMSGKARIFRGGTAGQVKALVDSHLAEKIALYDELIRRVEGYEPNDPKQMDALHKRVAIEALMGNG